MYDKFKNRFIKLMKIKNFILRHIVICITSFIILISGIGTLLFYVGKITSFTVENVDIIYGESSNYETKVFLGSPSYLHKESDSDEWKDGLPINPGSYEVKSYSKRLFGQKNYTDSVSFNIGIRDTIIKVNEDTLNYGEKIELTNNLAKGDYISNIKYDYKLVDESTVKIIPMLDTIKISNQNDEDVTSNYNIETIPQDVKFTKNKLDITTTSINGSYKASAYDNEQYQITNGKLGYKDKLIVDFEHKGIKDHFKGENKASFKVINEFNNNVTRFYDINVSFGEINVHRKALFITTGTSIKPEDGNSLSNIDFTDDGLLDNHVIVPINYAVLKEPGSIDNTVEIEIYDESDNNVTDNYRIYLDCGTLTITPYLVFTSNSKTMEYDGTSLFEEGYTINKELPKNHYIEVIGHSELIECGSIKNKLEYRILNELDDDVTLYYNYETIEGDLTVTKRDVTLTSNEDTKMYDGYGLNNVSFKTDRLLNNHHIEIEKVNNLDSDVGFYENSFSYHIYDNNHRLMDDNYNVTNLWNDKEIYKRDVIFESVEHKEVYKDAPIFSKEIEVKGSGLLDNHNYVICEDFKSIINVGSIDNTFKVNIEDNEKNNINHNYDIQYKYNKLIVEKRPIKINTESFEKYYDHKPIKKTRYALGLTTEDSGLIYGHDFKITGEFKTFVEPNNYKNDVDFMVTKNGEDVTSNYYGTDWGTIIIKKPKIVVTTGSSKKEYDGTPLTNHNYTVEDFDKFNPTIKVNVTGTITYVGIVSNDADIKVFDENGNDVTSDYKIIKEFGTLEITKLTNGQLNDGTGSINKSGEIATKPQNKDSIDKKDAFIYTTNSLDKIYFRAYSFGDYAFNKWEQPIPYETKIISPMYFASETIADKYETKEIYINLNDKLDYLLPYYTINGEHYNDDFNNNFEDHPTSYIEDFVPYVYDYRDHMSVPNYLIAEELEYYSFVKENYLSLPASTRNAMLEIANANGLYVNSKNIIFEIQSFMRKSSTFNKKFKEYPKDVDMAVHFLNKTREGNSQHFATAATCLYRALGIPARYTVGFIHQPVVGKENIVTWGDLTAWVEVYIPQMGWVNTDVISKVVDTEGNETLPDVSEKQTIYIRPVTVNKGYDGTPLLPKPEVDLVYCKEFNKLVEKGYTYHMEVSGSQTENALGHSYITNFIVYDPSGHDVTDKYEFIFLPGDLEVTKPQVVFIVESISKFYDGKPINITKENVTEIFPEGYDVSYKVNGNLNKIGTAVATIDDVVIKKDGKDVTNEMYIKVIGGNLAINKIPIEITMNSGIKNFDGTPLLGNKIGYRISNGNLMDNHTLDVEINSSITDIGLIENRPTSIKIIDENGNNVKFAYDIHVIQGTLEVI